MSQPQEVEPVTERKLRSSTRNPRRRQRQSDNDTLKATGPRRKRSKISQDDFNPRDSTELSGPYEDDDDYNAETITVANGHAAHHHHRQNHRRSDSDSTRRMSGVDMTMTLIPHGTELAVRGGKKGTVKRAVRGDGATVLTQNDYYGVKMLPSTPKELRREGVEYRGSIGDGRAATLAVAVTRDRALVWDYTAHVPSASQRVFDVPFAAKSPDPLPFALLVSSGAGSTDIGLLLVSATTGKVVYYESIDRATAIGLFQDRKHAVEGSLGNLYSGESVTDLISAEHAGFIVVFSSGRVAHLTLRDTQGKPNISTQYLRASDPNTGGLLGSIKGLWNGGLYIRNLAAVHVRPLSARGQMQVVSLTERAELLLWDLDWSGRSDFKGSFDLRESLNTELDALGLPGSANKSRSISALDFAIMDNATAVSRRELTKLNDNNNNSSSTQPLGITLLLSTGSADMRDYALAELSLVGDQVFVIRVIPIKSYHGGPHTKDHRRARLVIPSPGYALYLAFEDAVVVVINKETKLEGPAAQLSTAFAPSVTFEDTVYLHSDKNLLIQNLSKEDLKMSQSSCVAFVKSAGLVRISSYDLASTATVPRISAKTKIEQAVFHGILQENILDFSRRRDVNYDVIDIESAALAISDEILRATSPFIKPSPTSMEQHLASKAQALQALVSYVRQNFPALSQASMWRLLWDAERIAAGRQLWAAFEEHITTTSKAKRKATLLDELCAWFDSDETEPFPRRKDVASEDPVRRFFIAGLHRLERLLGHTRTFLRDHRDNLRSESTMPADDILQLVVQANDVWLRCFETVFAFRTEHAAEYGILPDSLQDGIIIDPVEYTGLGEFWTSTEALVHACVKVAAMSREFATKIYEKEEASVEIEPLVRAISPKNPRLIQLYCLMQQESINWRATRPSERDRERAEVMRAEFDVVRYNQFRSLSDVGQTEAAMELAEKYRDMHTLTDLVVAEDQYLEESSKDPTLTGSEMTVIVRNRQDLEVRIRRYFDHYGEAWADAFFDMAFSGNAAGAMLTRAQHHWKAALTAYLQARPSRAKICWINDVMEGQDFDHASGVLAQAAKDQENRLWAKKVELSMSKLALMAAEEAAASSKALTHPTTLAVSSPAKELVIADVQDKLYKHILPEIIGALDRQAEVSLCMEHFGTGLQGLSSLRQLLEQGFGMVLDHAALSIDELIDVLTLMNTRTNSDVDGNLRGGEFYLALVALDAAAASIPPAQLETLLRLIWKRCYIHDDWAAAPLSGKTAATQSDAARARALASTAIWHTHYHALDAGFFARPDCRLRVLAPRECLGIEDLAYRFGSDGLLDPILHDLRIQDQILTDLVVDRRLDELAEACRRDAVALLAEQVAESARFQEEERAVEDAMAADGIEAVDGNGTGGRALAPFGNGVSHDENDTELSQNGRFGTG